MRLIDADATIKTLEGLTELCRGEGATLVKALVFAALKSQSIIPTVSGWVSVNDRLPDPDIDVLLNVYCNWSGDYYQVIAWRTKMGDWDSNDDGFNQNDDYIAHWMPLPEPPEEVKGDA